MTVETQVTKVSAAGNDVATVFSFSPLVIFESSDLQVTHVDSDGVETSLAENTDYTVSVASYPGTGSITYPVSGTPLATGDKLVMKRVLTLKQTTDLDNQGGYFPDTQEQALDRLCMVDLQQQEEIERSIKIPVGDNGITVTLPSAAQRAGLGLVFDASGHITAGALASVAVSAAMSPVVQASTLALARAAFTTAFIAGLLDDLDADTARATLVAAKAAAGSGLALSGDILSLADYRGALVSKSGAQSIPNAVATAITWDTENRDTDALHSGASNTERLTVPAGVTKVRLRSNIQFAANATGTRTIGILKNGGDAVGLPDVTIPASAGGAVTSVNISSAVLDVAEGDHFVVSVTQNSGGNLNVEAVEGTWFEMEIVR